MWKRGKNMPKIKIKDAARTAEQGYAEVKGLIFDQVHKFRRRFGGDLDDLIGEAHVAFVQGHAAYYGGRANSPHYDTEIRRWVWYELFDAMRTRVDRKRRVKFTSTTDNEDSFVAVQGTFDTDAFMRRFGDDAQVVVRTALQPPPEVATVVAGKGGTPRNFRSTLRTYLKEEVGWPTDRINEAFAEVMEAL